MKRTANGRIRYSSRRGYSSRCGCQRITESTQYCAHNCSVIQVLQISKQRYVMVLLWIALLAAVSGDKFQPHIEAVIKLPPIAQVEKAVLKIVEGIPYWKEWGSKSDITIHVANTPVTTTPVVTSTDFPSAAPRFELSRNEQNGSSAGETIMMPAITSKQLAESSRQEFYDSLAIVSR